MTQFRILPFLSFLFIIGAGFQLKAQSTMEDVQAILSTNCTFSSCHDASTPAAGLNFSGSATDVFNQLVGQNPVNPSALSKGYKLVDPGLPSNSFLMHKVARASWDDYFSLELGEGGEMPTSADLNSKELETIRQWILWGAPSAGVVIDPALIDKTYDGMALEGVTAPPPPPEGEGIQIRIGSILLDGGEEEEFFYKMPVSFPDSVEVTRTEVFFNDQSHHFILYKYEEGTEVFYSEGLRRIYDLGENPQLDISMVAAWQDAYDIPLPENTAYFWGDEETLDMNFHLINTNPDSVLPSDVYVNIYTRPRDPSGPTIQMISQLIPMNALELFSGTGYIGEDLIIPGDGLEHEFEYNFWVPFDMTWHIWYLSSHTHSRGIDFDIFHRENQIFEGFFNRDYTSNQGFYDWEHPPVRIFEPPLATKLGPLPIDGIKFTAKYINNTGTTMTWGDRTTDEMMLFFTQYTEEPLVTTAIEESEGIDDQWAVGPSPFKAQTFINYNLAENAQVSLEVYDVAGRLVKVLDQGKKAAGSHRAVFKPTTGSGMYTIRLIANGQMATRNVVQIN
ncbi:MAG: hypothetical protein ACI959_001750 [Limisphaerales bacterium]|jgi:hypothetical protein